MQNRGQNSVDDVFLILAEAKNTQRPDEQLVVFSIISARNNTTTSLKIVKDNY